MNERIRSVNWGGNASKARSVNWGGNASKALLLTMSLIVLLVLAVPGPTIETAAAKVQPILLNLAAEEPDSLIEVIVQKTGANDNANTLAENLGATVTKDLHILNAFAAQIPAQAVLELAQSPDVNWISFDGPVMKVSDSGNSNTFSFRSDFNEQEYDGRWAEIGEDDGPQAGDVAVTSFLGGALNGLRIQGAEKGIQGQYDLNEGSSAVLSFGYRRKGFETEADAITVEASRDGSSWTELDRLDGPATDPNLMFASYDVTSFMGSEFNVRFVSSIGLSAESKFYLDYVQVEYQAAVSERETIELAYQVMLPIIMTAGDANAAQMPTLDAVTFTTNSEVIRDSFNAVSYSNNDGSVYWKDSWQEYDPYGWGSVSGGYVYVQNGRLTFHYAYDEAISRQADLSGYSSAALSFDWQTSGLDYAKTLSVLISKDGVTFTELDAFGGSQSGSAQYDISNYLSANTTIKFGNTGQYWEQYEYAYIDNVQIDFSSVSLAPTAETVLDRFNAASYANNDGSEIWSSSWVESDPNGGGAAGGNVWVGNGRLALNLSETTSQNITRQANLTGSSQALLSFDWQTSGLNNGQAVSVLISKDGSSSFDTLGTLTGSQSGTAQYDISSYISGSTTLRFEGIGQAANMGNLLVNGGFESVAVADNSYATVTTLDGWVAPNKAEIWDSGHNGQVASGGERFAELDVSGYSVDSIYQDVTTTPGQTYTLRFDMKQRNNTWSTSNKIEVYWNGSLLGTYTPSSTAWQTVTLTVTGTGYDRLGFYEAASANDGNGSHLDNVILYSGALLELEAENARLSGNFKVGSDANASDGRYIYTPNNAGSNQSVGSTHWADFVFVVSQAGAYTIEGDVYAPSGNDDSFWVTVDGLPGSGYYWAALNNTSYASDYVNNRNAPLEDPVVVNLAVGQHTVRIYQREDGARLDALRLKSVNPSTANGYAYLDNVQISYSCLACIDTSNLDNPYVQTIRADQVWNEAPYLQGQGVTVAVVDSGIAEHVDLTDGAGNSRILTHVQFITDEKSPDDLYGHGTHVAGSIAGNGLLSDGVYMGVAPKANLVDVKVIDDHGAGYTSDVVAGIQWIYENHEAYNIRVVNLSLNSAVVETYDKSPLDAALEILWFNGLTVVVSAGNNGQGPGGYLYAPANDPFFITVGATDDMGTVDTSDDILASFSAHGNTQGGFQKPDVLAPGTDIISLLASDDSNLLVDHPDHAVIGPDGSTYFRMSGTSMSSGVASGVVALLLQDEPGLNPDQVKYRLIATGSYFKTPSPGPKSVAYLDVPAAVYGTTTETANTGISPSKLLWSGSDPINWGSVNWGSVNWGSVNWGSVNWGSVNWGSVNWGSVNWGS